ncbi:thioredoxin family protein [Butyricimonas synergistica]|uniref:thioredoxin family protein n=1 Tax=Butyricimonas synergistica TaxID=544644 RepID=UPI00037BF8E7|nr:thioredoxin family protein [Butyricimonas synergistica]
MKSISCFVLLLCFAVTGIAQNRSIKFEQIKDWSQIIEKAKETGKLVFVDCFTEWCGPCKMLSLKVFTNDSVADYFNEHFVCVKFDMEKDRDGMMHKDTWGVTAFPTLLFIDAKSERSMQKLMGFRPATALLESARKIVELAATEDQYERGRSDAKSVCQLVVALRNSGKEQEAMLVMNEYFKGMTPEQMATPENWAIIFQCTDDILSFPLSVVNEHRELFSAIPGKDQQQVVEYKLNNAVLQMAVQFATNPNLAVWDQGRYNAFVTFLETFQGEVRPMAAVWLNTSSFVQRKQWQQLLAAIDAVHQDHILPLEQFGQYLIYYMTALGKSGEKKYIDQGIIWLDAALAQVQKEDKLSYYTMAILADAKLHLCNESGRFGTAKKAQKEFQGYIEKYKTLKN